MERSRVGPFALEEKLGADQTGSVYRAVHIKQSKSVAIRFLPAPLIGSNKTAQQEYVRQWETLKQLRHSNVARFVAGGFGKMDLFMVNELVHGQTLADVVAGRDRLPWEMVVEYSLQIAAGLEAAHELGLVHEALSLDKIMVADDGRIKLLDFRGHRRRGPNYPGPQQQSYDQVSFLAPEQVREEQPITLKCDLYALGCIMFRMLTGRHPFDALTAADMRAAHLEDTPPRVSSIVMDCPVWLDVLVGQLLERRSARRPHNARTVILALQETKRKVAEGTGVAEHALAGFSPLKPEVDKKEVRKLLGRKEKRRKRAPFYEQAWFLGLCLFLVLGLTVTWLFWPISEDTLIRRADRLMAKDSRYEWEKARRWYLEPLLKRFPDGKHAARAQQHMDVIEMDLAERRMRVNARLGRPPRSEGARLYGDALRYETFGDRLTALKKYEALVNILDPDGPERPYVNLARRQIAAIEDQQSDAGDRTKLVADQLAKAKQLVADGDRIGAHKIWTSIVALYGDDPEMKELVQQAQDELEKE